MSTTAAIPIFWPEHLRALLGEQRFERARSTPDSVDVLTWNVFQSLDTHTDRDWLAYQLQPLAGAQLRAPVRISLWSGKTAPPLLQPSSGYVRTVRERAAATTAAGQGIDAFRAPIEVPVRIESPDVLALVDTTVRSYPRGAGGRDRFLELIDAGLVHARRLSKTLAVGAVYASGTRAAEEISARLNQLRDPARLTAELPYLESPPTVLLREFSWHQLLAVWRNEGKYLDVPGSRRRFLDHVRELGLYQE